MGVVINITEGIENERGIYYIIQAVSHINMAADTHPLDQHLYG